MRFGWDVSVLYRYVRRGVAILGAVRFGLVRFMWLGFARYVDVGSGKVL